jgi:FemAB-related protein (PEP-CTERM system-associated)
MHEIRYAEKSDRERWDGYVRMHAEASLYHLIGWRNVFHRTYGHKTYYLMATAREGAVLGVLPLVHFKHVISGNALVSLPFVDGGGILADSRQAQQSLLAEAVRLGRMLGAATLELRQEGMLACCSGTDALSDAGSRQPLTVAARSDKARMLLDLPATSKALAASFKSKLRSQINKPLKAGFASAIGGLELLDDFYEVFLANMRDLGSPVHSLNLMRHVLEEFGECCRIFVVHRSYEPVASALVVGFDEVLRNPWASSLRRYATLGPNMLLYLRMLEYACDRGFRAFDFGRSTVGEGTYKFKEQWGALPVPLYWYYLSLDGKPLDPETSRVQRFGIARHCWRQLPLIVTRVMGPQIRKHISL